MTQLLSIRFVGSSPSFLAPLWSSAVLLSFKAFLLLFAAIKPLVNHLR